MKDKVKTEIDYAFLGSKIVGEPNYSLRDEFAKLALNSVINTYVNFESYLDSKSELTNEQQYKEYADEIARRAYMIADAMLKERHLIFEKQYNETNV